MLKIFLKEMYATKIKRKRRTGQGSNSLEFLKKSSNLLSNFPALEKVLKIEINSGKIVESLERFDVNSDLLLNRHMATWNLLFYNC